MIRKLESLGKKIALIGVSLYSLTSPVYAVNEKTKEDLLLANYKSRLEEAVKDSVLTYKEAKTLSDVLSYKTLGKENENSDTNFLDETKELLEEKILIYYPGLITTQEKRKIDGKWKDDHSIYFETLPETKIGLYYSASDGLSYEQNEFVKGLVINVNEKLKSFGDERLLPLIEREQLTLKDLVAFYNIITETDIEECLKEKYGDLIINCRKSYDYFLENVEKAKNNQLELCKKSWVYMPLGGHPFLSTQFYKSRDDLLANLKEQGYDYVKIPDIQDEYPIKTKIPFGCGIFLGLFGSFVIRSVINVYIGGRKNKWGNNTFYDYGDVIESISNGLLGIIADNLHPIVFPARMGLPIFIEGIRELGRRLL